MTDTPTLLVVDHAFHRATQSFEFVRELLRPHFRLTDVWATPRRGLVQVDVALANRHSYVVFCQVFPSFAALHRIRARCIWLPMYDGVSGNPWFWERLRPLGMSTVSFAHALHRFLDPMEGRCLDLRYYCDPARFPGQRGNPRVVFMWDRGDISPLVIGKLFSPADLDRVILLRRPDAARSRAGLPADFVRAYRVEEHVRGFADRAWYLDLVRPAGIYVAPRRREGIGMTLVEALAMGKCVIGHREATMNEYLVDGDNGFLMDCDHPHRLDPAAIARVHAQLPAKAADAYVGWQRSAGQLVEFVRLTPPLRRPPSGMAEARLAWRQFRCDLPGYLAEARRRWRR